MKYNRAFIIRDKISKPLLLDADNGDENTYYWLMESKESFHGVENGISFYFKDSRLPSGFKLPIDCVELEFSEDEVKEAEINLLSFKW